jgi:SGNH hydrolase-like domain, acetyltransferase AlgX
MMAIGAKWIHLVHRPGKYLAKRLALFVLLLMVCLGMLEGALRIYSLCCYPKMIELDDKLGWKHAKRVKKTFVNEFGEKSFIVQNDHGQRGKNYDYQRENGKYRILVLGDSFADGQMNEAELFSARLERSNPYFEVINAGVSGFGTVQEYLYLISEGIKYQPDLVLLMFYENDLYDNGLSYFVPFGSRPDATLLDHELRIITKPDPAKFLRFTIPVPFRSTLHRRSYLYYFLNTQIYHRVFWNRLKDLHYADLNEMEGAVKFELFYEIVKRIHQYLTARNVRLVLVLIPTREEISLGKSDSHRLIREFCSWHRISCLSLLDRFKQEGRPGLYFPLDIHWTPAGHRVAAEEIALHIQGLKSSQN